MSARKTQKRAGRKLAGKTRKMWTVSTDVARRLSALAAWQGRTESAIVEELLEARVSGVYVGERGAADPTATPDSVLPRLAEAG